MRETAERLSSEAVEAMRDVLSGVAASDAWLEYVRRVHPTALDILAKIAVSNMAIDLLQDAGELTTGQAEQQRTEAADAVVAPVALEVWEEIYELRSTLDALETHMRSGVRSEMLDLGSTSPRQRIRAS